MLLGARKINMFNTIIRVIYQCLYKPIQYTMYTDICSSQLHVLIDAELLSDTVVCK